MSSNQVSRLGDPDIIAAANFFRKKNGMKPVTTLSETKEGESLKLMVNKLSVEIADLKRELSFRDKEIKAEVERAKIYFEMLNTLSSKSLQIAVTILVYWDNWGFLPATVFTRLEGLSEEFRRIKEIVSDANNYAFIKHWLGKKELIDALKMFGYGKTGSVFRGKERAFATWGGANKAKKSKTTKKAKKEVK